MELGPIFRSLMYNKARFWLVALEIALTLAIVANCVNMMLDMRSDYLQETGIDEENIVVVWTEPFAPEFQEEEYVDTVRETDLAILTALPGVVQAASVHAVPLSGGGSATGRKPLGSELDPQTTPYFVSTQGMLETLGVELIQGRDFVATDFDFETTEDGTPIHRNIVLSEGLATALFPDGDALGKMVEGGDGTITNTIVGIVKRMPNSWPDWSEGRNWSLLFPGAPGNARGMRYMVRTEPGALDSVFGAVEEAMLASNDGRIVRLETMVENKAGTFGPQIALVKLLTAVIGLLLLVTSLGVVGLTAFSVAQRRRQIGTRRALGATRSDILRYFLVENWLITGLGLAIGVALTFGLNVALVEFTNAPKMPVTLVLGGMLMLWITGILAALMPAWRASLVTPEVATRTV